MVKRLYIETTKIKDKGLLYSGFAVLIFAVLIGPVIYVSGETRAFIWLFISSLIGGNMACAYFLLLDGLEKETVRTYVKEEV